MSSRRWRLIAFEGAVAHIVGAGLEQQLFADLLARGRTVRSRSDISDWGIDEPGMVHVQRPIEKFRFLGSDVSVPS